MTLSSARKLTLCCLAAALACAAILSSCRSAIMSPTPSGSYGVFLSIGEDLESLSSFDTVVIDAQYFDEEEIREFCSSGHRVLSYINVGALEDFRSYYDDYSYLGLGEYEHWSEEIWMDVSSPAWQAFILDDLAPSLREKGIDGFFVDNCDVYYQYPTSDVLEGLGTIMEGLRDTGLEVVINGGDTFLDAYCDAGGSWEDVITGINQESVFSKILWEGDEFSSADPEDNEYFRDYIERYGEAGADIYLLEYTTDPSLIRQIDSYCSEHGFTYYVSDSVELDG